MLMQCQMSNANISQIPRISRVNTIGLVILLVLVVIALALRNIIEPLVLQALAACGFLKAYEPREDGDGNDSSSITAKDTEVQGVDKWTKQCSVPYTGERADRLCVSFALEVPQVVVHVAKRFVRASPFNLNRRLTLIFSPSLTSAPSHAAQEHGTSKS